MLLFRRHCSFYALSGPIFVSFHSEPRVFSLRAISFLFCPLFLLLHKKVRAREPPKTSSLWFVERKKKKVRDVPRVFVLFADRSNASRRDVSVLLVFLLHSKNPIFFPDDRWTRNYRGGFVR